MQVRKRDTSRIYALKTIRKAHIVSRSEVTHTLAERTVLAQVNNPFIVPLKFSFQSKEKLYLVLAFVNGGELFHHLQREGKFNEERSRFYAAELLVALEHLHGFNVVYRFVASPGLIRSVSCPLADHIYRLPLPVTLSPRTFSWTTLDTSPSAILVSASST
jgi:serine/threonine protein kinase